MREFLRDFRYAARGLRRRPSFTALAVAILALGTGVNTAIFSVAKSVLIDPLPYPDSDRLVWMTETRADGSEISVSYPNYVDWRDRNRVFESVAAFTGSSATLPGDPPERLNAHVVSGNFFATLGVPARLGRTILPSDDLPGAPPVVYLSHALWARRFGSNAAVVGRAIPLGGASRIVVGVAPPDLRSYDYGTPDAWIPLGPWARDPDSDTLMRKSHAGLYAVGRLRRGRSLGDARAEMERLRRVLAGAYPAENGKHGIVVRSLRDEVVGDVRPALLIVSAAAGLFLLIACANVSNLLLARWAERRREIAIRVAIGADRLRLVRQLLTESLVLAGAGSLAGLAVAAALLRMIPLFPAFGIARLDEVTLDARVLAVLAAATVGTAILFGLAPALGSSAAPGAARRDSAAPDRGRLTGTLIAVEIAVSLVLLCATALLGRSLWRLLRVDPGFQPSHVLTARLDAPEGAGPEAREALFFDAVLRETRRSPGVLAASAVTPLPLGGANRQDGIVAEGRAEPAPEDVPSTDVAIVDPAYFRTMGIPLLRGRGFLPSDRPEGPRVAVVSAAAARKFWPGQDPIGRRFTNSLRTADRPRLWFTVVGIVGDIRLAVDASPASEIYYPAFQRPMGVMTVVVRTEGPPESAREVLAAAVRRVDPGRPLYRIASIEEIADRSLAERRLLLTLLAGFAAFGLLLSVGGLSGVVGRIVAGRTREIGIRIALGAAGRNVVAGVLRGIAVPVAAGIAGGLGAALVARQALVSVLYGVAPGDAAAFVAVPFLLALVAAAAAWFPARRAARIEPMRALREE